ncbi:MAG: hypothetical protein OXI22_05385, partial [Defluviicoccus sp.]|nr:hypothetical protein [Defluviicoccus sp.]
AITGAAPERALARAAGSLTPASAAEWSAIVLALVVVLKAAAIAQAAEAGPVGGILIGSAAIAYACQIAALHGAPDGDSDAKPALGPVGIALGVAAAISLIVMAEGWLAAVILAGAATGGIVYAVRRPGAALAALPAVLALAEILALLAVVASR